MDVHRGRQGSLPEKVLADGRPAPLAWAAAAVVIAADQLGQQDRDRPVRSLVGRLRCKDARRLR